MMDKFNTILFILLILSKFYPGQILSAVRLKICPLQTIFVRLRQTVRTCETLGMKENLSIKNNIFASADKPFVIKTNPHWTKICIVTFNLDKGNNKMTVKTDQVYF